MNFFQFIGSLELGLIYGLVTVGVYLTFRVIDFSDLTVDGTLPLGASVAGVLIINGISPFTATVIAMLAGAAAGCITGILNVRWNIIGLLAGILTMTALYSVNLRIMGVPNIGLLQAETLFTQSVHPLMLITFIVLIGTALIVFLMKTDYGLSLRAIGKNARVSRALGVRIGVGVIAVLALSNGLVALSGALLAQMQGFADVSMGMGTIIIGLVSVVIGETLFKTRSIVVALLSCLVGSVIYRLVISMALNAGFLGLKTSDLNLITAVLVTLTMIIPTIKKRRACS